MTAMATPFPQPMEQPVDHLWQLRLEEFEEGHSVRAFECVDCGAVRYE